MKTESAKAELVVSLEDYEGLAKSCLDKAAFDYISSGSGDGYTLRRNREAFQSAELLPRVLVDVSRLDTRIEIFGRVHEFPVLLAPTGYHKLFHPDGELETVRGANLSGATLVASCFSTVEYGEMRRQSADPLWFQLYFNPDRGFTRELVDSIVEAGCEAIVITVDVPVNSPKDRQYSSDFRLPDGLMRANLSRLGQEVAAASHRAAGRNIYNAVRAANATWKDIEWLRSIVPIPLVMKGVLRGEDARTAVTAGCDGIIVSNHGGRALDGVPATFDVLPGIVDSMRGEGLVLMDGGLRRGVEVLKALARGAHAVLIGRPYLHGLTVRGAQGVKEVVDMLRLELEMAMALTGCRSLKEIDASLLRSIH
ncbi:MAG TPA: alpha-hydroxy acid oxidase [Acidobacteriaceae bacterium]|nr:alpha-hydroxy acid oxidase [Acidobacteriaceae bacterium]